MEDGRVRNPLFDEFEVGPIHFARTGNQLTITYTYRQSFEVELLDQDGLDKTKSRGSSSSSGGESEKYLEIPDGFQAGTLRFRWTTWTSDLEIDRAKGNE